ncbi:MAG TPA: ATP-binding protein [Actinoplanes sp.]|jgi:signal transduction histidine kinase
MAQKVGALFECEFGGGHLGGMRSALARVAADHRLTDRAQFNFILVVNELTTNAIRHGGGRGCVRLWRQDDDLWCEVVDDGPGIDDVALRRMREPGPGARGHGLWLTRHICADVHIDTGPAGTRIRLRYPLPAARPESVEDPDGTAP